MAGLYAFRCWTPRHPLPASSFVAFSGPSSTSPNDLRQAITDETDKALSPQAAYLIYPESLITDVEARLNAEADTFAPLALDTAINLYSYDKFGKITLHCNIRGEAIKEIPADHIRRQGLTILFSMRGGLLEAGPTAHFVKPSRNIDSRFLRASHALAEGVEIFFVAFWLLRFPLEKIHRIHIDTSAIASVVFAVLIMRGISKVPPITTFHSYEGLPNHKFDEELPELVVISASQSGGMAHDIGEKVHDVKLIVTLFSTAEKPSRGVVLCDLRYDPLRNIKGLHAARLISDTLNTRPIRIIGEHFIAQPEPPRPVLPALKHAPDVIKTIMPRLRGQEIFASNKSGSTPDEVRGIWVNVRNLVKSKIFKAWVAELIVREVPASIRVIVYPGRTAESRLLADAIYKQLKKGKHKTGEIDMISLDQIEEEGANSRWIDQEIPILIAETASGHGEHLLSASRALRQWAPNSHRIFLSIVSMPSSELAFKLLHSNLCQPNTHKFLSMLQLFVDRRGVADSWLKEAQLLSNYQDNLPAELLSRLDDLNSSKGLYDNLFLAGARGKLELRNNFAFWPEVKTSSGVSQGDVFACICTIVERMRSDAKLPITEKLINDTQTHSIISAVAFSRYNDGVIQAAFLRAARPVELNYRDADGQSRMMGDLLCRMVELVDKHQGEGLTEFLLALVTERLVLEDVDKKRVLTTLARHKGRLTVTQAWLFRKI